jgi:hypothetical protein
LDTTDGQGSFSFSQTAFVADPNPELPSADKISMTNGVVNVNVAKAGPASGYSSKDTAISFYQGTVNVTLDTLELGAHSLASPKKQAETR